MLRRFSDSESSNNYNSHIYYVLKNTKNIENIKQLSENSKMVFFAFLKTVLKSNFKKYKLNKHLIFFEKCFYYMKLVFFYIS